MYFIVFGMDKMRNILYIMNIMDKYYYDFFF